MRAGGRRGLQPRSPLLADRRPRVGADRRARVRRSARPYRAAAGAGRGPARLDAGEPVRGRDRDLQPAAGPCVHPALHLLGLVPSGHCGRAGGRARLHPPRARPHPRAFRALPGLPAGLGPGRGRRRRGGGRGGRGPCRMGAGGTQPRACRLADALGRLRGDRVRGRRHSRRLGRPGPAGCRHRRGARPPRRAASGRGGRARLAADPAGGGDRRGHRRARSARLGGAQGRCPLIRWRLRDRAR